MPTVSPSQSNAGDLITAGAINNPVNQLAAVINGNIDANNIADNSITTAKVATGLAVTKLSNPYKFSYVGNASQGTTSSTALLQKMDTKEYDTSSNYSTSSGLFTAPVAGFYHFEGQVSPNNLPSGNQYWVMLYKNGSEVRRGERMHSSVVGGNLYCHIGTDLQLAAGDTIGLYLYATNGCTSEAGIMQYFQGYLLSTT